MDLRISMLPTVDGESVVIRLLNTRDGLRRLGEVGFSAHDEQVLRDILGRDHGMLLVTGPTGCGKSTTLYAALLEVRKENLNIITVGDPVEYHIPEIEQIQVNRAAGTTFARTLRNILRHDPDVIMIGEIRDEETAQIAVDSALTGHLVLSTPHEQRRQRRDAPARPAYRTLPVALDPARRARPAAWRGACVRTAACRARRSARAQSCSASGPTRSSTPAPAAPVRGHG